MAYRGNRETIGTRTKSTSNRSLGGRRRAALLPAAGGGGAGKVSMQDFHFTMPVNKASPALFLACAQGDHIKNAILTCRKAGKKQQEFMKVTMSDVLVSLFQIGGAVGVVPTDQISLNFAKIEVEYQEQDATGKIVASIKKWFDLNSMKGD